jgi:AcrR family transcriptional regulator
LEVDIKTETREKILIAAQKLYQEKGIKKTTMTDIADLSGVTRVTVYQYFPKKRELIYEAFMKNSYMLEYLLDEDKENKFISVEDLLTRLGVTVSEMSGNDLAVRYRELAPFYPEIFEKVERSRLSAYNLIFDRLLDLASEHGVLRNGIDREFAKLFLMGATQQVLENWSYAGNIDKTYALLSDAVLNGIIKR